MEREAYHQTREVYGKRYDSGLMVQSQKDVAAMLGEQERQVSVRKQIQQIQRNFKELTHYTEPAKNR